MYRFTGVVAAIFSLALHSGSCASILGAVATRVEGDAAVRQTLRGRLVLEAFVRDASSTANGERLPGTTPGLQLLNRQATSCAAQGSAGLDKCLKSCDVARPRCTARAGAGCDALAATCTLPGCCLTVNLSGKTSVTTACYNGCCVGMDQNKNVVDPVPCHSQENEAAGAGSQTTAGSASPPAGNSSATTTTGAAAAPKKPAAPGTAAADGSSPSSSAAPRADASPAASPSKSNSSSSSSCFPGHALVELESGRQRRMDQLRIGDRVKVATHTFSDVFMFTHKLHSVDATFVVIRTVSGHVISATPGHYVYVNGALASTASVKIGDKLELSSGAQCTVVSVSEAVHTGLFNPQTLHGDIVVNGILASTYTTAVSPLFGHAGLCPVRMVYSALGMTLGLFENGADLAARVLPGGSSSY